VSGYVPPGGRMAFELTALVVSTALLLVHIMVQATLLTRDLGSDYNAGPRDEGKPLGQKAGRAKRALANFLETYPAFIALALVAVVADRSGWLTQWGAALYLVFRTLYIPLYIAGVPYIRSLAWTLAGIGLAMMFVGVLV
jgi:uncharacterized MAPEG superfamily protein